MPYKERPRLIANVSSSTKLFTDDLREIARLADLEKRSVSDLIRELTHEALRTRRLRAAGRDEAADYYRQHYRELLQEGLQPLTAQLAQLAAKNPAQAAAAAPSAAAPERVPDSCWQRAQIALATQQLHHLLTAENLVRVLLMLALQREQCSAAEIQQQLALPARDAETETQQIVQAVLAQYGLVKPLAAPENISLYRF